MPPRHFPGTGQEKIGGAECAARTGLSLRALRVYEQQRLIRPDRSAKGWRQYGASDLARLNSIRVLKSLGLTLAQIRDVLSDRAPSLEEVLHLQAVAWRARKQAARKAIELIDGALRHLAAHRSLSMDTLCELLHMYALNPVVPELDERISQNFAPHESRLWSTWWAKHPEELAASARFSEGQLAVLHGLKALMDGGQPATDDKAQALMRRWEALFLSHGVRQRTVRQLDWNYEVTFRWFELVHKNRVEQYTSQQKVGAQGLYTPRFAAYLGAAHQGSAHGKALEAVLTRVRQALAARIRPASAPGRNLARALRAACAAHALGDARIYARFALFIEQVNHGRDAVEQSAPWQFLVDALQARPRRGPAAPSAVRGRRRPPRPA